MSDPFASDPILQLLQAHTKATEPPMEPFAHTEVEEPQGSDEQVDDFASDAVAEVAEAVQGVDTDALLSFSPRPPKISKNGSYSVAIVERCKAADRMHPGVKLGRLCISKNIPVTEVAAKLGVSRPTVYSWFTGQQYPKDSQLQKIKEALLTYAVLHP